MTFNNSSNKVRVIGFIVSDIKNLSAYAIEFLIAVQCPERLKKASRALTMFSLYTLMRKAQFPLQEIICAKAA